MKITILLFLILTGYPLFAQTPSSKFLFAAAISGQKAQTYCYSKCDTQNETKIKETVSRQQRKSPGINKSPDHSELRSGKQSKHAVQDNELATKSQPDNNGSNFFMNCTTSFFTSQFTFIP